VIKARGPGGEPRIAATCRHQLGDYLRAALGLGLQVRGCEEPAATGTGAPLPVPAAEIGDWHFQLPAARTSSHHSPFHRWSRR